MKYGAKWPEYARQWDAMKINASRRQEFENYAKKLFANKTRYQKIEKATGVPWYMIAVLYMRESDADFSTYLGNGEPLNRRTRLVPKGRGPFKNFEEGAIDALRYDGLTNIIDWRLEKIFYYGERYNGPGYMNRGLPSPYLWGGTNIQKAGKYIADGRWSSSTWDRQPGIVPMIKSMMALDPTIKPKRED